MSDAGDDEFSSLKPSLRRAVDTVFLKLAKQRGGDGAKAKQSARKKRRVGGSDDEDGGGFVRDDEDEDEDEGQASDDDQDPGIPLSLIPTGLQMLDLAPDDQEVLAVFRNAATGWENPRPRTVRQASDEDGEAVVDKDAGLSVSKDDWRAVCAVLVGQAQEQEEPEPSYTSRRARRKSSPEPRLATRAATCDKGKARANDPGPDSDEGGGFMLDEDEDGGFELNGDEEVGSDSDGYSEESALSDDSASEFGAPTRPKTTRAAAKNTEEDEDDSGVETDDMPLTLTARQEREARIAFALFFPDMDANDPALDAKKIGIREVGDAAKVLNEKIPTDDIIEMLGMFSSGPSRTVGLEAFGRLAVMAKLV
ncbi:hypothetical protein FRC10_009185 [Ceratobasidium sp. 414]|nr:hypothetical protein FRC10_009185 [Ceratobasidium sp. 414]